MGKKLCGDVDLHLFSEDVLINILVCLPVNSLLRFKSVCKSWRQLIQSSFFIHQHTTTFNSSSSSKFGAFILQIHQCHEEEIKLFKLSSGDGDGDGDGDGSTGEDDKDDQKMVFKLDNLGFSPFYKDFSLNSTLRMVGSCNGIICLHDPRLLDVSTGGHGQHRQHYSNLRDVYLWNPATRQFRILPKSIPVEEKKNYMGHRLEDFIAFGLDVKTKDYKVLRIAPWEELEDGGCMCRVQVYSLSTDSWRLLEGIDYLPVVPCQHRCVNHGIYLNGSYFFGRFFGNSNIYQGYGYLILSFDFTKEIFTVMQLPTNVESCSVLSYLGDKMVVSTTTAIGDGGGGYLYYDIGVLNEQHGGGGGMNKLESRTKFKHSFRIKRMRGDEITCTEPARCILSNNGEFAFISTGGNKFWLFNLITKEAEKDFTIGGNCRADVYQESLVSILGGGNVL